MTERRSRSARSVVLGALLLTACAAPARHPLEAPPPSPDLVGQLAFRVARAEDTLVDLAPELGVGYVELLAANPGVDPWLPAAGTRLVVPGARLLPSGRREGIVVNLGDLRLYHFDEEGPPHSYPIGVAREGFSTPLGETTVRHKRERPTWHPGPSARRDGYPARIGPGPDNPLGEYALYLGWPAYLIHGTNEPRGVGRHTSRGCIRLYPRHIEELYVRVEPGTPVRVVSEPVKLGWIADELYLEVNPDWEESLELDERGALAEAPAPEGLRERVTRAAGSHAFRVDWAQVDRTGRLRQGIPTRVTRPPDALASPARRSQPAGAPASARALRSPGEAPQ